MRDSECPWFPVCPMNYFRAEGKLSDEQIDTYCKGDWIACKRYEMEQKGIYHPDNMLPDGTIDENLS